jgi:hypothetical protein
MINKIKTIFNKDWLAALLLIGVFLIIRIPGLDSPLHQDEYKWPIIVNPETAGDISIPHPPLSQFIYRTAGYVVGFDTSFRLVPLVFGLINLILLLYFLKKFFGKSEAIIGGLIWSFSFFSVLASLMVDTDGQIMPFFFLSAIIAYYHIKTGDSKHLWLPILLVSLVLGFFIKLSFLLAIGAIIADFLWSKKDTFSKQQYIKLISYIGGGIFLLGLLLFVSQFFFKFFNISQSFTYWRHFLVADRGWMQTFIQCVKAVFFMSPIILIPFLGLKEIFKKVGVFVFFLVFAFIFYILLFDFSIGALDRYLQLMILPVTVMSSILLTPIIFSDDKKVNKFLLIGLLVSVFVFILQYVGHFVPPLHPKAEWIDRIISLKWNFLYPFSGGSGPLGFYVSFLFIGVIWLLSIISISIAFIKPHLKDIIILLILPLIIIYNLVFLGEYLFGIQNGSAPKLLLNAVEYIKNNPDIQYVTVYNDNGGDEIRKIGKYRKRLYVDPKFDVSLKLDVLNQYKEHYFILDIPKIDQNSIYQKYFNSCKVIYNEVDKKISATIYDCRGITDVIF